MINEKVKQCNTYFSVHLLKRDVIQSSKTTSSMRMTHWISQQQITPVPYLDDMTFSSEKNEKSKEMEMNEKNTDQLSG